MLGSVREALPEAEAMIGQLVRTPGGMLIFATDEQMGVEQVRTLRRIAEEHSTTDGPAIRLVAIDRYGTWSFSGCSPHIDVPMRKAFGIA